MNTETIERPEKSTLKDFCQRNGLSENEVKKLIREKKVSGITIGGVIFVSPSVVMNELRNIGLIEEE